MPKEHKWIPATKTICLDFNGVLDTYTGWRGGTFEDMYPPRAGLCEFLQSLTDAGFTIIIFTAFNKSFVWEWLYQYDLQSWIKDVTDKKVPALIYVDDRAIQFNGNFDDCLESIRTFKTHWEDQDKGILER